MIIFPPRILQYSVDGASYHTQCDMDYALSHTGNTQGDSIEKEVVMRIC